VYQWHQKVLPGWHYVNVPGEPSTCIPCYFAISTILPAIMETLELVRGLRLFQKTKIPKIKIRDHWIYLIISIGLIFLVVPFFYHSVYMWALIWSGFIFLLDPVNYLFHEKSLLGQIKNGRLTIVISLFLAGYICGFFWEFFNYGAYIGWRYDIPVFGGFKIFEMPILGYWPYGFFAWELYVMYYFVKLVLPKKLEKELELS